MPMRQSIGSLCRPASWKARPLAIAACLSLAFAVGWVSEPGTADAHVSFWLYQRSDPNGSDKDPVNVLYTINGTLANTQTHFLHHVGWYDDGGSTMYFQDHGVWKPHQWQKASWCGTCERDHTRFVEAADLGEPGWGYHTISAAHYEVVVWCIHSSRSFDAPRDRINNLMSAGGHTTSYYFWANNMASQQCDGVWTSGNGWVLRVELP